MNLVFTREPDDRSGILRASIGGNSTLGYYLVFRGDPDAVAQMLDEVAASAVVRLPEGEYEDHVGRPQG